MILQEKFKKLVEQLNENQYVIIEKIAIGEATDDALVGVILNVINYKIPEIIVNFYNEVSYVKIYWKCNLVENNQITKYSKEDEQVYGDINILDLAEMTAFDEKLLSEYWTRNMEAEELEDVKNFRYFNKHDEYLRLGFLVEDDIMSDEIYYIQEGTTGFAKAPFSFEEYLDTIFKFKGFLGFEYNMLYPETESNERMQHYIKEIFGE
ncbi:hypothetical protein U8527_13740 [Kordia algicida OT-1]|uniref:Uncharacterized protein n=1 Tax=Kordia algicida OT-1 TaxID=391587 RepID=A9DX56_9FLAO|nr:hypothetical protein [Kordia algicida]EDP95963.1 hypothetical protein KAOT1_07338 [Kordia algicida OT-1]